MTIIELLAEADHVVQTEAGRDAVAAIRQRVENSNYWPTLIDMARDFKELRDAIAEAHTHHTPTE